MVLESCLCCQREHLARRDFPRGYAVSAAFLCREFRHRDFLAFLPSGTSSVSSVPREPLENWQSLSPADGREMQSWLVQNSGLVLSAGGSGSRNNCPWPFPCHAVLGQWVTAWIGLEEVSHRGLSPAGYVWRQRAGPAASIARDFILALPRTRVASGKFLQSSVAKHLRRDESPLPPHGAL